MAVAWADMFARLRVDDTQVRKDVERGVGRADFTSAGRRAGSQFAGGYYRDAQGRLHRANGQFAKEGEQAFGRAGAAAGKAFSGNVEGHVSRFPWRRHGASAGQAFSTGMKGSVAGLGKMLAGAVATVGGAALFSNLIQSAREAQRAQRITAAVIASTGGAAHVTARQVTQMADALSLETGVTRGTIRQGINMMLTFRGVRNEAGKSNDIFNQSIPLLMDMTAALGGGVVTEESLRKTAIRLGKALNDPITGMTALRRVGVTFTKQQADMVKGWVEHGQILRAQKYILAEIRAEFGKTAEAAADPFQRLTALWAKLKTQVGGALLVPFNNFVSWLIDVGYPAVQGFWDRIGGPAIGKAAGAVKTAVALVTTGRPPGTPPPGQPGRRPAGPPPELSGWQAALVTIGQVVRQDILPALAPVWRAFLQIKDAVWAAASVLLSSLEPAIRAIGTMFSKWVAPAISRTLASLAPVFAQIGRAIGVAFRGVMPLFDAIGRVVATGLMPAISEVAAGIGRMAAGLAPSVAAIGRALAVVMGGLSPFLRGLGTLVSRGILPIITAIGRGLAEIATKAAPLFAEVFTWLGAKVLPVLTDLGRIIATVIVPAAARIGVALIPVLRAVFGVIKIVWDYVVGMWNAWKPFLGPVIAVAVGAIVIALKAVAWVISTVVAPVLRFLLGVFGGVTKAINIGILAVVRWFTGMGHNLTVVWNAMSMAWQVVWGAVMRFFSATWATIRGVFGGAVGWIGRTLSAAWGAVSRGVSAAWGAVSGFFSRWWAGLKSVVGSGLNWIKSTMSRIWGDISRAASAVWGGMVTAIGKVWDGIKTAVMTPVNWVLDHIWNPFAGLVNKVLGFFGLKFRLPTHGGGGVPMGGKGPGGPTQRYERGGVTRQGIVYGGAAGRDRVGPLMLDRDEFVVRAAAHHKYGTPAMTAVNEGRAAISYARGGLPGMQGGGFWNWVTTPFRAAGHWVRGKIADYVVGPVVHGLEGLIRKVLPGTGWGRVVAAAISKPLDALLAWVAGRDRKDQAAAPATAPATLSAAQAYARSIMPAFAWGPGQWPPLYQLWQHESGWRWNATNPDSGAYGIPQALPGAKMATAGADWRTNFRTQINWGENYIAAVYGNPATAWARWLARLPHWYGKGGRVRRLARGGVLREPVLGIGRSGRMYSFAERGPEPVGADGIERRLDRLIDATERLAERTGQAVGAALDGVAGRSSHRATWSPAGW